MWAFALYLSAVPLCCVPLLYLSIVPSGGSGRVATCLFKGNLFHYAHFCNTGFAEGGREGGAGKEARGGRARQRQVVSKLGHSHDTFAGVHSVSGAWGHDVAWLHHSADGTSGKAACTLALLSNADHQNTLMRLCCNLP